MTNAAQTMLIDTGSTTDRSLVERASIADPLLDGICEATYPEVLIDIVDDGRGVIGELRLRRANPMGRSVCRVDVRRRHYWTDAWTAAGLRVAAHWFRDIGGLALLRAKQLGHIISRIRASEKAGNSVVMCERCMHWAIDAYANAEWHRDNKRWKPLSDFFMTEAYDGWLEQSVPYKAFLDDLAQRTEGERRRQREAEEAERLRSLPPLCELSDEALAELVSRADADGEAEERATWQAGLEAFGRMEPQARKAHLKRVRFELAGSWVESLNGPMTLEGEWFAGCAYRRSLHEAARKRGVEPAELVAFTPSVAYPKAAIYKERDRRHERRNSRPLPSDWARRKRIA